MVTLQSPRPHLRAAFALDSLDLNPFLSSAKADAPGDKAKPQASGPSPPPAAETAVPREAPSAEASPQGAEAQNDAPSGNPGAEATSPETEAPPPPAPAPDPPDATPRKARLRSRRRPRRSPRPPPSTPTSTSTCARRAWRIFELGASSLGLVFRDGVLNATLGGMDLYDGHATGKFVFDASKPVPEFTGDVRLEGVQAKTLALGRRAVQHARRPHQARPPDRGQWDVTRTR